MSPQQYRWQTRDRRGNVRDVAASLGEVARNMSDDDLVDHIAEDWHGRTNFGLAATAELQRRTTRQLNDSTERLADSVEQFSRESNRHASRLYALTVAIALLTAVLLLQGFGCFSG